MKTLEDNKYYMECNSGAIDLGANWNAEREIAREKACKSDDPEEIKYFRESWNFESMREVQWNSTLSQFDTYNCDGWEEIE